MSSAAVPHPDPARVEDLFHAALNLNADQQTAFLADQSNGDTRLAQAVADLIESNRRAATMWNRGALELEARQSAQDMCTARQGDLFGPYRILRRIAAGGMGFVYEALRDDAEFHKRVAVKFVHQGIDSVAGAERFRNERQILAELEHPYIARMLDGGTTGDGIPYLVMEHVDGLPIDRYATEQRLSRTQRLTLFLQVCEAVQYAHRNLVVHRDLKPGNILVTREGTPKLLDFGIATLLTGESGSAATTTPALTPEYASPEQVMGRNVGTSTDIYSLGVLLFVLLAERLPYGTPSHAAELLQSICIDDPAWEPAGLIDGELRSILGQALQKEPERRYLSVEQFAADVRRYIEGLPVAARPNAPLYRLRKFARRRAIPIVAALGIVVALVAGGLSTLAESRRAERRFNDVRGLAHSLLFDVYDSISDLPHSLRARQLVAARAQQYLDSLAREASGDSALTRELAECYLRLGDVRGAPYAPNLGDTAGALETYGKARIMLEREAARNPSDAYLQQDLAEAYLDIGRVLSRQGRREAIGWTERAVVLLKPLGDRNPDDPALGAKLYRAYSALGQAWSAAASESGALADYLNALETYKKFLSALERIAAPAESLQSELAGEYNNVGYALDALSDKTGDRSYSRRALEFHLKGDRIIRTVAARNPGRDYSRVLADSTLTVGITRWKCCRDFMGSLRDQRQALAEFQRIAKADPENAEARRDLANAYGGIGMLLGETGRLSEALAKNREALRIYEQLGASDPTDRENASYVELMRARIARLESK